MANQHTKKGPTPLADISNQKTGKRGAVKTAPARKRPAARTPARSAKLVSPQDALFRALEKTFGKPVRIMHLGAGPTDLAATYDRIYGSGEAEPSGATDQKKDKIAVATPREIPRLVDELHSATCHLADMVEALQSRLDAVLSPAPVGIEGAGKDQALATGLGGMLDNSISRVARTEARVRDIMSRLEL